MKEKDNRAHNLGLHLPEELSQIVLVFDRACGWNVQRRIPDPRLEPLTSFLSILFLDFPFDVSLVHSLSLPLFLFSALYSVCKAPQAITLFNPFSPSQAKVKVLVLLLGLS